MKKILLVFLVSALFIVSCGKSNKTNTAAVVANANPLAVVNTASDNITVRNALMAAIDNNAFNQSYVNGGAMVATFNLMYTCQKRDGIFGIDYLKCGSNTTNGTKVALSSIDIEQRKSELRFIVSQMSQFRVMNSTTVNGISVISVELLTNDNQHIVIDTNYPIQANPIYKWSNSDRSGYYKSITY